MDKMIETSAQTIGYNKAFLEMFEATYEQYQSQVVTKDKKKKKVIKEKLDKKMINEIRRGIKSLKKSIVEKYIEEFSTLSMLVLVAIFSGLGLMFYKVNQKLNKAHLFWVNL